MDEPIKIVENSVESEVIADFNLSLEQKDVEHFNVGAHTDRNFNNETK